MHPQPFECGLRNREGCEKRKPAGRHGLPLAHRPNPNAVDEDVVDLVERRHCERQRLSSEVGRKERRGAIPAGPGVEGLRGGVPPGPTRRLPTGIVERRHGPARVVTLVNAPLLDADDVLLRQQRRCHRTKSQHRRQNSVCISQRVPPSAARATGRWARRLGPGAAMGLDNAAG